MTCGSSSAGSTTRTRSSPPMIPSLCLTARRLSCLVFVNNESGFAAYNFGRPDERLSTVYTQGYDNTQPGDQLQQLAGFVRKTNPKKIGINTSPISAMCDGLSKTLHDQLVQALDEQDRTKLTSAYTLCTRWIEARTEEELSPLPQHLRAGDGHLRGGLFPQGHHPPA